MAGVSDTSLMNLFMCDFYREIRREKGPEMVYRPGLYNLSMVYNYFVQKYEEAAQLGSLHYPIFLFKNYNETAEDRTCDLEIVISATKTRFHTIFEEKSTRVTTFVTKKIDKATSIFKVKEKDKYEDIVLFLYGMLAHIDRLEDIILRRSYLFSHCEQRIIDVEKRNQKERERERERERRASTVSAAASPSAADVRTHFPSIQSSSPNRSSAYRVSEIAPAMPDAQPAIQGMKGQTTTFSSIFGDTKLKRRDTSVMLPPAMPDALPAIKGMERQTTTFSSIFGDTKLKRGNTIATLPAAAAAAAMPIRSYTSGEKIQSFPSSNSSNMSAPLLSKRNPKSDEGGYLYNWNHHCY
jgi:hypothetical protein